MSPAPIRLGIIGSGIIAGFLARDFAAIPGVELRPPSSFIEAAKG